MKFETWFLNNATTLLGLWNDFVREMNITVTRENRDALFYNFCAGMFRETTFASVRIAKKVS